MPRVQVFAGWRHFVRDGAERNEGFQASLQGLSWFGDLPGAEGQAIVSGPTGARLSCIAQCEARRCLYCSTGPGSVLFIRTFFIPITFFGPQASFRRGRGSG